MDIKQDFRVYCSTNFKELNKSLIEDAFEKNDELILEGIASTTSVDEEGDYMTKACLEDMKRQAIGLSVLKEHGRKLDDILGKVISIPDSDSDKFLIRFKILPKFKSYIMDFIDNEINLGLSIGAKALDYEPIEDSDYGWKVNKARLYEISLIPLPANWDSFGSVKMSKEISEDIITAKCFNGACKQLIKENSSYLSKELEDAQKDEEDKYVTKKEALNMMNEQGIALYDRLLSELLDECKNMIERNHLDDSRNSKAESQKENSNDDNGSSNKKEDKEKEKGMKEEIDKKVETEETPNVQKELEESQGASTEGDLEVEKEVKKELGTEEVTIGVSVDEVSNKDVLKSIEDLKAFVSKGIDDEINSKIDAKLEEVKKSIPNVEDIKKELREEVEQELFKELTTEREPTETEQPKVEEVEEVEEEKEEEVQKTMSAHDIAKMLCS